LLPLSRSHLEEGLRKVAKPGGFEIISFIPKLEDTSLNSVSLLFSPPWDARPLTLRLLLAEFRIPPNLIYLLFLCFSTIEEDPPGTEAPPPPTGPSGFQIWPPLLLEVFFSSFFFLRECFLLRIRFQENIFPNRCHIFACPILVLPAVDLFYCAKPFFPSSNLFFEVAADALEPFPNFLRFLVNEAPSPPQKEYVCRVLCLPPCSELTQLCLKFRTPGIVPSFLFCNDPLRTPVLFVVPDFFPLLFLPLLVSTDNGPMCLYAEVIPFLPFF